MLIKQLIVWTITNSGTIEGGSASIVVYDDNTTGTNIVTKGEGTYIGEITFKILLQLLLRWTASISKHQDIDLTDKTNITIHK